MSETPMLRRPRFSLLTLLLVTAVVALSFGIYRSWDNERRMEVRLAEPTVMLDLAEKDIHRLRRELAQKANRDPSRIQADLLLFPQQTPTARPLIWTWFVSIPEGRHYTLHLATEGKLPPQSPLTRPPQSSHPPMFTVGSGEHEITFRSFRHSGNGKWVNRLAALDGCLAWEGVSKIPWGEHRVFTGKPDYNGDPTKPFVIGRCEVHAKGGRIDGLMIWLEPSVKK